MSKQPATDTSYNPPNTSTSSVGDTSPVPTPASTPSDSPQRTTAPPIIALRSGLTGKMDDIIKDDAAATNRQDPEEPATAQASDEHVKTATPKKKAKCVKPNHKRKSKSKKKSRPKKPSRDESSSDSSSEDDSDSDDSSDSSSEEELRKKKAAKAKKLKQANRKRRKSKSKKQESDSDSEESDSEVCTVQKVAAYAMYTDLHRRAIHLLIMRLHAAGRRQRRPKRPQSIPIRTMLLQTTRTIWQRSSCRFRS